MNQLFLHLFVRMEDYSFGTLIFTQGFIEEKYVGPYLHSPVEKQI